MSLFKLLQHIPSIDNHFPFVGRFEDSTQIINADIVFEVVFMWIPYRICKFVLKIYKQFYEMDRLLWNKQWHKHCDYYYGHGGTNNINAKEGVLNRMSYSTAIMVIVLSCKLNGELFFCEQEKYEKKNEIEMESLCELPTIHNDFAQSKCTTWGIIQEFSSMHWLNWR